ncbi:hypothetical protein MHB77_12735 [Paenibacillus sp. FSL K6-3166]|uniref:hypothetical protein n=1 Tax=unclassified Paenibacillus TaxID=185978 RepID=UPI000BA1666D|nr:hypothetical protein [Paenibacillus sp. VTT E-133291]OZQ85407.1 hypothetical protein CA598_21020 [Paenibacillus sp. VTT E-133291]
MIKNSTNNLINEFTLNYSKEEFEFLITLFPYVKVTELIKKSEKTFREYTKGYRLDKLPLKKLQEIYYKGIYTDRNLLLAKQVKLLIIKYISRMDEVITTTIGPIEGVRNKIELNDMNCFEQLMTILLDHKYDSAEKSIVYFKMNKYDLSESQMDYIMNDFEKKLFEKNLTKKVTEKISVTYDTQMSELKKTYESVIRTNEVKIDELMQLLKLSEKNNHELLLQKEKEVLELDRDYKRLIENLDADNEKSKKRISELDNKIDDLNKVNQDYEDIINNLSSVVNMKYEEYCATVEEVWTESNTELIQSKNTIQESIDELCLIRKELTNEIDALEQNKTELENNIMLLDNKGIGVIQNIQSLLKKIGFKNEVPILESRLLIRNSGSNKVAEEVTSDKSYFIDDLAINLNLCGIRNDYTNDLSHFIYASISRKLSLLVVGYNSRGVADALSFLIEGSEAEIITLPPGYDNSREIMTTISNSTSKVILIENAIDNTFESVYLPLLKNEMDHILLFSLDSSENISLLPKSFMDYMMLIDLDSIIGLAASGEEMLRSLTDFAIFKETIQEETLRRNFNLTKKLNYIYPMSQVAKIKFAEVMSVIDMQNSPNALYDIIMFSLNLMCNSIGKSQELIDYVDQNEFSPMILKMLHEAIELGEFNE